MRKKKSFREGSIYTNHLKLHSHSFRMFDIMTLDSSYQFKRVNGTARFYSENNVSKYFQDFIVVFDGFVFLFKNR